MKRVLAECEADVLKAAGGNKAAGTRVRKAMQDVKNIAQELRKSILDAQKSD
ncbi:MAG: histone H1 [Phycisphaerae bacterium]|nr:histone H1 [Phycisphaerae bacterium]HAW96109.1 histone H1 [Phycisphaerales bacterium]